MRYCITCGKSAADDALLCEDAKCRGSLGNEPLSNGLSKEDFEKLSDEVFRRIWRKYGALVGVRLTLVGLLGFMGLVFGVYNAYVRALQRFETALTQRISDEFKTERIRDTVSQVASNQAKGFIISEINPKVEEFQRQVSSNLVQIGNTAQDAVSTVKRLEDQSKFLSMMTAALSGSRTNFEKLQKLSKDKSSVFANLAGQAVSSAVLLNAYNQFATKFTIEWKEGVDPQKVPFSKLAGDYPAIESRLRPALIEFIGQRSDIPKSDRLSFLLSIIQTEESLRAVFVATHFFAEEAKINDTFNFDTYSKWWAENKDKIK